MIAARCLTGAEIINRYGIRSCAFVAALMATIITFGEAMIRLTPPQHLRLEQTRTLEIEVGGAELNTAVGLARLGHAVTWVSALPDNPLGRLVANRVREAGVDARWIQFDADPAARCGLYFLEQGAAPRPSALTYDRRCSAAALVRPGQFDWDAIMQGGRWFHISGITPAISCSAAAVVGEALTVARKRGLIISFDLNYRAKLWSRERAAQVLSELLPRCDVLFASAADAAYLFGVSGENYTEVANGLGRRFGVSGVFGTARAEETARRTRIAGMGWWRGTFHQSREYEVEVVDRLGAGDAFAAGVIHGLLYDNLTMAVEWGTAMAALKHTIPGDWPWVAAAEIESVLRGQGMRVQR